MDYGLIFYTAANAVLPVVLLILLGYGLRRTNYVSEQFVKTGNKLVFNFFLPAMLFINVYDMPGLDAISWDLVLYGSIMVLVLFALGVVLARVAAKEASRRGVILQASFRSNMSIIGLSLAAALGNDSAVGAAAMLSAFSVAEFNILAVLSFTVFSDDRSEGLERLKKTVGRIFTNPLILSICAGMVALVLRELQIAIWGSCVFRLDRELKFVYTTLSNMKSVTTPLALVILGGQFVFSAMKDYGKQILAGVLMRIVVAPALGIGLAFLLSRYTGFVNFGPDAYPAMIALFGSPVAVSSAIMASQMGGDDQLATQLIVWSSIGSIFTVFATACILMATGVMAI